MPALTKQLQEGIKKIKSDSAIPHHQCEPKPTHEWCGCTIVQHYYFTWESKHFSIVRAGRYIYILIIINATIVWVQSPVIFHYISTMLMEKPFVYMETLLQRFLPLVVASELEGFANAVANAENGMQTFRPTAQSIAQWSPSELRGLSEPVPSTKVAWTAQAVCKISWSVMRCVEARRQGRWWAMESYEKRFKKYISWTLAMFFLFLHFFPPTELLSLTCHLFARLCKMDRWSAATTC